MPKINWKFKTDKEEHSFKLLKNKNRNNIDSILYISESKYIICGTQDNTVEIFSFETGECVRILRGHKDFVTSIVAIPNTKLIISGSHDRDIIVWNYKTG